MSQARMQSGQSTIFKLEDDLMLAAPASIALKRVIQFVTLSIFTIAVANYGSAADLRLPINATQRSEKPPGASRGLVLHLSRCELRTTRDRLRLLATC